MFKLGLCHAGNLKEIALRQEDLTTTVGKPKLSWFSLTGSLPKEGISYSF